MGNNLVARIFGKRETFLHGFYGVSPVCISSHVFVNALDADFYACTTVKKQVTQVGLRAEVRTCLDSNTYAL